MQETPSPVSDRAQRLASILESKGTTPTISIAELVKEMGVTGYDDLKKMKQEMTGFLQFESTVEPCTATEFFTAVGMTLNLDNVLQAAKDGFSLTVNQTELDQLGKTLQEIKETLGMPVSFKIRAAE
jgi:hypothetical protein